MQGRDNVAVRLYDRHLKQVCELQEPLRTLDEQLRDLK